MRSLALMILLAAGIIGPSIASAQLTTEDALAKARVLTSVSGCFSQQENEVVVCGRRGENRSRYRVPAGLLNEVESASRPDLSRASAEPVNTAGCGIFEGQRRCSKREAAEYGYGLGRDPVTVARKVLGELMGEND